MDNKEFVKIRMDAGLSIYSLSDMIRVHPRTIRRFENGTAPISGPVSVLMELINDGVLVCETN